MTADAPLAAGAIIFILVLELVLVRVRGSGSPRSRCVCACVFILNGKEEVWRVFVCAYVCGKRLILLLLVVVMAWEGAKAAAVDAIAMRVNSEKV